MMYCFSRYHDVSICTWIQLDLP